MEAWTDLYIELAGRINNKVPEIKWVDLWHEQVSYLSEELPFPTPAVFISFSTNSCDDESLLIQNCDLQIDMYLFFETFSDTYIGAYNQASAIDYLLLLTSLHTTFHGKSGVNFSEMRRVAMRQEESGGSGNMYRISFACITKDASAQKEYDLQVVEDIEIEKVHQIQRPSTQDDQPLFDV